MTLQEHRQRVERLSSLAAERQALTASRRRAYQRWKQKRLANLESLTWIFAAGAVWGLIGSRGSAKSHTRRLLLGASNLGVLAWRQIRKSAAAENTGVASRGAADIDAQSAAS